MTKPHLLAANRCPNCGNTQVSGLMASFFVPLDQDGEPDGDWNDWNGESELTPTRTCHKCDHEWESST